MLYCERGIDVGATVIMFDYLSEETQEKLLAFKNVSSPYELDWDVIPVAQLPYGTVRDFEQDELDLQALTQVGYYRRR
jgi:hypothetical protein